MDPWIKHDLAPARWGLPSEAVHLLTLEIHYDIDTVEESYFLHSPSSGIYELWIRGNKSGVAIRVESTESDSHKLGRKLIYDLCAARTGMGSPTKFAASGSLSKKDWKQIEAKLLVSYGRRDWKEISDPHNIIHTANALVLHPFCVGISTPRCRAQCPSGRSHFIDIDPHKGFWYCGYCKQGGNNKDLQQFAEKRKD